MNGMDFSMPERLEIGLRIQKARNDHGWTLKMLGQKIGVTHVSIHNWEKAKSKITQDHLRALSVVLDVSLDYLMLREPENAPQNRGQYASKHPARRPAPRAIRTPRWMRVIGWAVFAPVLAGLTPAPQDVRAADTV